MGTFADSNRVSLRGIPEDTANWGVTPVAGNTRELRITSSSLALNKDTVMSDELRADRMVPSIVEVSATTEGDINFELSAGSHDEYLQAFVLGAWSRPMTFDFFRGNIVSWDSISTIKIAGGDYTGYYTVGRYIKTEGFANPNNNGYFSVSGVAFAAGVTTVTVAGTPGIVEAGRAGAKIMDANDVIVANSADIRLGTAGAATIDSNATNAFAAAVAAGQLVSGQNVFVEGAGLETGTVTFTTVPTANDTISVSDGQNSKLFIAGTDFAVGALVGDSATNLAAAINLARSKGLLEVSATAAAGVVTLKNLRIERTGAVYSQAGLISEVVDGAASYTVVNFAGFDPDARGYFTIISVTDDVLTVDRLPSTTTGTFTIKGSMLRNPGDIEDITPQSFTLETAFNDVGQYMVHDGVRIGTYSLEVSSGSIVTGSMSVAGKATNNYQATKLGDVVNYTVLQSTATEVMNATTNVGNIKKDGLVLSYGIQSITIEGDATLRNQMAVSSKFPRGIGTGRFQLSGSITAYFENLELWNDFKDHETVSVAFDFSDGDNNAYIYTIPAMKFASDPVAPGGIDQDINEEIEWMAFRDAATKCMLQVDRFSSVYPV